MTDSKCTHVRKIIKENYIHYDNYKTTYAFKLKHKPMTQVLGNLTAVWENDQLQITIHRQHIYEELIKRIFDQHLNVCQIFGKRDISKEISEIAPIFHQLSNYEVSSKTLCYVIGEGILPKISYLLAT